MDMKEEYRQKKDRDELKEEKGKQEMECIEKDKWEE